ncbi:uncharacterized protein SETTUDRAFT_32460 [Exserohilum turcica Et28A]|uniref:Uncharacterized protein n=1 Tax=Exserohilum turcicum (strain 28A) TaxID=671987 RepID=R0K6S8_EXST2|nr:uncharacterized protein SETTUDRAFT_32460 [Exserohilum turcica Et28A]EOA85244.1 hypothetical protein SETTUDRAFT_32460 [Exserohilum turcica Et28A]
MLSASRCLSLLAILYFTLSSLAYAETAEATLVKDDSTRSVPLSEVALLVVRDRSYSKRSRASLARRNSDYYASKRALAALDRRAADPYPNGLCPSSSSYGQFRDDDIYNAAYGTGSATYAVQRSTCTGGNQRKLQCQLCEGSDILNPSVSSLNPQTFIPC